MTQSFETPKWPKRCKKCIKSNGYDPSETIYCDPDIDCPYYPFLPWLTRAQRVVVRRLQYVIDFLDEWLEQYYHDEYRNKD